jgi:hypothetical protein
MGNIPLDIKCQIAEYDQELWIYFYLYYDDFAAWARELSAQKRFIELFTVVMQFSNMIEFNDSFISIGRAARYRNHILSEYDNSPVSVTMLFGWAQSIYDAPAVTVSQHQYAEWRYRGCLHRENDQPAVIFNTIRKEWYLHGNHARANRENTILTSNNEKYWTDECGHYHRENDLPAFIGHDGTQIWAINNKPQRANGKPVKIDSHGIEYWVNEYGCFIQIPD